eukprot:TRINITY_DN24235_c0_g1_i2.p1 TRINITY_DN24235_c0_g1~~TRINITY_DN24235_c0_g1_i2.p1  ORF type:complete len:341 (+),score=21.93 TRINITY_DN24235_c0_g1_i2:67-1089(+)
MPSKVDEQLGTAHVRDRRIFFGALFGHGSARVLSKIASAPLERVKVCLQVGVHPVAAAAGAPLEQSALKRIPGYVRSILLHQGPTGFWRGAGTHVAATCLAGITRLSALRTSQMWTMPGGDHRYIGFDSYIRRCAFLYAAGATALLVAYPLDTTYTCLAADNASPRRFQGVFDFMKHTRKEHGVLSIYRGFPVCLITAIPFVAVATAVHDLLAPRLLKRMGQPPKVDHRAAQPGDLFWLVRDGAPAHLYPWNLIVGGVSGIIAQTATYPLDTLRRRWQHSCAGLRSESPRSFRQCVEQIRARGEIRYLYNGVGMNAAKLFPELVVLSGVYLLINASGWFL